MKYGTTKCGNEQAIHTNFIVKRKQNITNTFSSTNYICDAFIKYQH